MVTYIYNDSTVQLAQVACRPAQNNVIDSDLTRRANLNYLLKLKKKIPIVVNKY